MKKILQFRSHSEAERFKTCLKALCPGSFLNIFIRAGQYCIMVSGAYMDTEIHQAAGLARITDYKTVESNP